MNPENSELEIIRIVGFDPGLSNLGWAYLECCNHKNLKNLDLEFSDIRHVDSGVFKQSSNHSHDAKLELCYNSITDILDSIAPDYCAHELMFLYGNHSSAASTIKVIGFIELLVHQRSIKGLSVAPQKLKKEITGSGRSKKPEMKKSVLERLLPEADADKASILNRALEHEIDACAISLWVYDQISGKGK